MIRSLLSGFDLFQRDAGVAGRALEHSNKELVRHKVRTGTGGQIASAGQKLHGPQVNLLVALARIVYRAAALGEGGRIQDDEIVFFAVLLLQGGQQIKDVAVIKLIRSSR